MENWHTYHSEKLWFMLLVHFFPSTTITQDYLLFGGKPSTKHLRGSYGLCFLFRWRWPDPSAGWVCVPILIIQVGLESLEICESPRNIKEMYFLFPLPFLELSILIFFPVFFLIGVALHINEALLDPVPTSLCGVINWHSDWQKLSPNFCSWFVAQVIAYLWVISKFVVSRK